MFKTQLLMVFVVPALFLLHKDSGTLKTQILQPTVRVENNSGHGSGVIIHKEENDYYVLTAYHVIQNSLNIPKPNVDGLRGLFGGPQKQNKVMVSFYNDKEEKIGKVKAKVLSIYPKHDSAIIVFTTVHNLSYAILSDQEVFNKIQIADEVYAVGCQLQNDPIVTRGIISGFYDRSDGKYILSSAQISPGSSGGGLFIKIDETYYLIGIAVKTSASNFNPIPHLAYFTRIDNLFNFVDKSISHE